MIKKTFFLIQKQSMQHQTDLAFFRYENCACCQFLEATKSSRQLILEGIAKKLRRSDSTLKNRNLDRLYTRRKYEYRTTNAFF